MPRRPQAARFLWLHLIQIREAAQGSASLHLLSSYSEERLSEQMKVKVSTDSLRLWSQRVCAHTFSWQMPVRCSQFDGPDRKCHDWIQTRSISVCLRMSESDEPTERQA